MTGYVELTKEEADIVAKALNLDNWKNTKGGEYCGSCEIDNEHPIEVKE